MAVNPNTNFSTGAVYTADQANRFPRGIMCEIANTATTVNLTTSYVTQLTTPSFTAVTGRLYKITYHEPISKGNTAAGIQTNDFQIRSGATVLAASSTPAIVTGPLYTAMTSFYIGTLTAGATVITAWATSGSTTGTPQVQRAATYLAYLIVEDIGAA